MLVAQSRHAVFNITTQLITLFHHTPTTVRKSKSEKRRSDNGEREQDGQRPNVGKKFIEFVRTSNDDFYVHT